MQTLTKKITYDEYRRFEADDFFITNSLAENSCKKIRLRRNTR